MSSRKATDSTSQSGVNFTAGSATSAVVKNINLSLSDNATRVSKLGNGGAFNGHAVEVWSDGAVWDTVSSKFLQPGTDFNPGDVQRT